MALFLLALLPFRPRSGVGSASAAWRVLSFTCAMPGGVFPRWVGLLAALLEVYLSIFEQLVSMQGASASPPLFPREKGRGFWGWLGGTGVASGGVPSLTHGVSLALGARCPSLPSRLVRHP